MIEKWKKKLGLEEWTINTEQIDPASVTYPDDCVGDERFFVGIMPQEESLYATIFHDRPLTEQDVVHELLHVRHPSESETWINHLTHQHQRTDRLESLIKIEEAIQHFENQIVEHKWSNDFGAGLEWIYIRKKNTHNIDIYEMCIDRLNERFNKQLFAIRESQIKNK